jgi:hypothetical protein
MQLVATAGRRTALVFALIAAVAFAFFTQPLVAVQGGAGGRVLDLMVTFGISQQEASIVATAVLLFGRAAADQFPFIAPVIDVLLTLPLPQMIQF